MGKRVGAHGGTFKHVPVLQRFLTASSTVSTREVCPPPAPNSLLALVKVMALLEPGAKPKGQIQGGPFVIGGLAFRHHLRVPQAKVGNIVRLLEHAAQNAAGLYFRQGS